MRLAIERKIKQTLISELDVSPHKLAGADANTPLLGRGVGLDSMETLALVSGVEAEFDIQIEDQDLNVGLFKTIGTFADFVQQKVAEQKRCSLERND